MNNKLILLLLILMIIVSSTLLGQVDNQAINWMTWDEVEKAQEREQRKVLVDVYTEWCGWCKKMDQTTFKDPDVIRYINENFYAIKFDAETQETIHFNGRKFKYVKNGRRGYNQLASDLLKGKLSYPSTVFLNENLDLIQPIPGYLDAKKMETVLSYFSENQHKKTPWTRYEKDYVPMKKRGGMQVTPKTKLALPGQN